MKKIDSVKEFVEKIDSSKKVNPKDLSSDQDLSIAIMNLISIEEHLVFSGAKTGKNSFYDLIRDVREMRKNLMQKIIPSYEGEVWCISNICWPRPCALWKSAPNSSRSTTPKRPTGFSIRPMNFTACFGD